MPKLQELLAQKASLDQQIQSLRNTARADAIARIKTILAENGLTVADLGTTNSIGQRVGTGAKTGPKEGAKVRIKYRDGAGNTWSGRGLQPRWLKSALADGKSMAEFAI